MTKEERKSDVRKEDAKYPLERLKQDCLELFGVTTATFVGATAGLEGEFSVAGVKKRIDDWKTKEAK